jgi:hypothetical protein
MKLASSIAITNSDNATNVNGSMTLRRRHRTSSPIMVTMANTVSAVESAWRRWIVTGGSRLIASWPGFTAMP